MKKLIIGNWKMNLSRQEATALATRLAEMGEGKGTLVVCPPAIWLCDVGQVIEKSSVLLGAQDASPHKKGAFTGDIATPMLADAGVRYVLVGHSERRQHHHEDNALIRAKAEAAQSEGLVPVICFGETEAERAAGRQEEVVATQLAESLPETGAIVLAYEPVWAIGTGKTATIEDVDAMHRFIRGWLERNRVDPQRQACILYGGSVKAANAAGILALADVGGVLVGGASLDADEFWAIAQAI